MAILALADLLGVVLGPVGCVVQLGPGPVFELEGRLVYFVLTNSVAGIGGDVAGGVDPWDPPVAVDVAGCVCLADLSNSLGVSGPFASGTVHPFLPTTRGKSSWPSWVLWSPSLCRPLNTVSWFGLKDLKNCLFLCVIRPVPSIFTLYLS